MQWVAEKGRKKVVEMGKLTVAWMVDWMVELKVAMTVETKVQLMVASTATPLVETMDLKMVDQ